MSIFRIKESLISSDYIWNEPLKKVTKPGKSKYSSVYEKTGTPGVFKHRITGRYETNLPTPKPEELKQATSIPLSASYVKDLCKTKLIPEDEMQFNVIKAYGQEYPIICLISIPQNILNSLANDYHNTRFLTYTDFTAGVVYIYDRQTKKFGMRKVILTKIRVNTSNGMINYSIV